MKLQKLLKSGIKYLTNTNYRFLINTGMGFYDRMPDEEYLKRKFKAYMGRELDLENPRTFNEKLQWLKLYDRRSEYTVMADKYRMREFVEQRLGPGYTIPLLGVWNKPDEIDFEALPDQFVLKCNHNSGLGMCICRDKSGVDFPKVRKKLEKGLKQNYYLKDREWPYKDIPRKIIAEKFVEDDRGEALTDYKFFCFNGIPRIMYISKDNAAVPETDFFDMDFNHLMLCTKDPNAKIPPQKPEQFEKMKEFAQILAKDTVQLRVDFYVVNEQIYVGELTFFHNAGFSVIRPESWGETLGEWIALPEKPC